MGDFLLYISSNYLGFENFKKIYDFFLPRCPFRVANLLTISYNIR